MSQKKRGRKKKEAVISSSDNLNNFTSNTIISHSESTGIKKGRKKKAQKIVEPLSLNDSNDNVQGKNKRDPQDFTITSLRPSTLETEANNQNMQTLSSKSSLIYYRPVLARESRIDFDFSNRSSRMNPTTVPDSRANDQFDHISLNNTLRSRPMSPLASRNNSMNILMNDICNTTNNSIHHFGTINKVVEGSQLTSSILFRSNTIQNQENNKTKDCHDFLEELKYLFLCVRNPHKSAFEELVQKIFKCELNSVEGIKWLHIAIKHFRDFRNKLVNNVEDLVGDFKNQRSTTGSLQKEEIIAFVNESATVKVLERWLNATNIEELKAQNSIHYLYKFIQRAFAINYLSRDTERTKTLDNLMKNITVPSRN
ncbi:3502_t:CDS:2, partial [Dentiscutata erythropus]